MSGPFLSPASLAGLGCACLEEYECVCVCGVVGGGEWLFGESLQGGGACAAVDAHPVSIGP